MNRRDFFRIIPAAPVAAAAALTSTVVYGDVIEQDNETRKPLGYVLEVDPEIIKMMPDILMDNGTLRQYPLPRAGQMMAVPGRVTPIYETMNVEVEILD